jgi:hypothetical protein
MFRGSDGEDWVLRSPLEVEHECSGKTTSVGSE